MLAADLTGSLTGVWTGWIERPNGEPLDVAIQLIQKGETLTGKVYDDYKSPPVMEGKVVGDRVSFVVVVAEQAGNEIRQSRYRYEGKVVEGQIEMTRDRESSINAANGGGVQPPRNATKQTFRLKRLIAKVAR